MKIYNDDFTNKADIVENFQLTEGELEGAKILFCSYMREGYDGDAFVLFERGGKLYENHGAHCSCFGLGGQREPEETSPTALSVRLHKGTDYGVIGKHKQQIISICNKLIKEENK